ncbi:MAG: hypothetical protein IPJ32_20340 [Sphingobacteriaceae bacterium]|nr:hypothetical protein [Sphingobacteriaceae bacterium]
MLKRKDPKSRITDQPRNIENLEEKHFIKEEMPRKPTTVLAKYIWNLINPEGNGDLRDFHSNLKEMLNEASLLSRNLRKIWEDGGISLKEDCKT